MVNDNVIYKKLVSVQSEVKSFFAGWKIESMFENLPTDETNFHKTVFFFNLSMLIMGEK